MTAPITRSLYSRDTCTKGVSTYVARIADGLIAESFGGRSMRPATCWRSWSKVAGMPMLPSDFFET